MPKFKQVDPRYHDLVRAAKRNMMDVVCELIDKVDLANEGVSGGVLDNVGANPSIEIYELLLKHGADPNRIDLASGGAYLHELVFRDDMLQHVELALKYGANPNMLTADGRTLLDIAIEGRSNPGNTREGRDKMIALLTSYGAVRSERPQIPIEKRIGVENDPAGNYFTSVVVEASADAIIDALIAADLVEGEPVPYLGKAHRATPRSLVFAQLRGHEWTFAIYADIDASEALAARLAELLGCKAMLVGDEDVSSTAYSKVFDGPACVESFEKTVGEEPIFKSKLRKSWPRSPDMDPWAFMSKLAVKLGVYVCPAIMVQDEHGQIVIEEPFVEGNVQSMQLVTLKLN